MKTVTVTDLFTRTEWFQRISNGPWDKVDLKPYGGIVPVVFFDDKLEWAEVETLQEIP